jgi:hypothetical protein
MDRLWPHSADHLRIRQGQLKFMPLRASEGKRSGRTLRWTFNASAETPTLRLFENDEGNRPNSKVGASHH